MTVLISYLSDRFSVLAADNRGTNISPAAFGGAKFGDDLNKLFKTPFGFFVGSGSNVTNDAFEYVINDIKLKSKKDIWQAFIHAGFRADKLDKRVCVMHLFISMNYWTGDIPHLEIAALDYQYQMREIKNKNVLVLTTPKMTKRIVKLNDEYKEKTTGITDLNEIVYDIAEYMQKLSKLSDLVSSFVSMGISFKMPDRIILMRINAEAKEIIKTYKLNKDLSELMIVEREVRSPALKAILKESVENVKI